MFPASLNSEEVGILHPMIRFSKYEGAGNDFILVDDREQHFPDSDTQPLVSRMCDRHFGIGADGLMLLRKSSGLDFEMVYYNSDGRLSSMCGNGGRCITVFAHHLGLTGTEGTFVAVDGKHRARIEGSGSVSLEMKNVNTIEDLSKDAVLLDTGSPHYVERRNNINDIDIVTEARAIRYSARFAAEGVNVNFIEIKDGAVNIRTYERGVEGETLACGTGVVASALAADHWGLLASPVNVHAVGGSLSVAFDKENNMYSNIWKTGPVRHVFDGVYQL